MNLRFALSTALFGMTIVTVTFPAMADPKEEALLPIERKISTFSIRLTKTGYSHFGPNDPIPVGSVPVKIIAIDGRSSKDIWLLTDRGVVLQDDGKQITFRLANPCRWGNFLADSNGIGTRLYNLAVDQDSVHVFGEHRDMNTRIGSERRASLGRDGKWICKDASLVPDLVHSSGSLTWRASHNMDGDACRIGSSSGFCTSGPRFSPTHVDPVRDSIDMGIYNVAMWMHGPDDGWVVTKDETFHQALYRFNGVAWARVMKFDEGVQISSMWADDQRQVWMTGRSAGETPATVILRHDGKNLTQLPTPASFATSMVRANGSRNVWFGGAGDAIYQWDGSRLRQGKAPGEVNDMWVSSDGVAFMTLPESIAFAAPGESK